MTNKQKAERFGQQIAHRYNTQTISQETAILLCNDFGAAHAKQPAAQDRMSYWARNTFRALMNHA